MNYNFYFKNDKEASLFIERAREIAKEYGMVTLSDLYELIGIKSDYLCNKISWSIHSINYNLYIEYNSDLKCYMVSFPKPFFEENKSKSYINKKKMVSSSEPINITISCMDLLSDPLEAIHQIFDMANQIKNRPVFITIS